MNKVNGQKILKVKGGASAKYCSNCKEPYVLNTNNFRRNKRKSSGFESQCRYCETKARHRSEKSEYSK